MTKSMEAQESGPQRGGVRRALVSVYDKRGVEELALALHAAGIEMVSTGSTAARPPGSPSPRSGRS